MAKKKTAAKKKTTARKKTVSKKKTTAKKKTTSKKKTAAKKKTAKKKTAKKKTAKKKTAKKKTVKKAVKKAAGKEKAPAKKKTAAKKKTVAKKKALGKKPMPKKKAAPKAKAPEKPKKPKKIKTHLSRKELNRFKKRLLALREMLSGQIDALKGASLERRDKVITEEDGTEAFDRDFALNLASSEQDVVFEIDEALRRIQNRTYGVCEMTGKPIEQLRLEAIPYTRLSIEAQTEIEKRGGSIAVPHRSGASRSREGLDNFSAAMSSE